MLRQCTRIVEDPQRYESIFYTARKLRNGALGPTVVAQMQEDTDEEEGGGLLISVSRTERVRLLEMRYKGAYAALLFASRTLLCWTVLGPWTPASAGMTDRGLACTQFRRNCVPITIKNYKGC